MSSALENFRFQRVIVAVGVGLFLLKLLAWWLTNSVAIFTDALEGIVNVVSGFIGLYSLYLSAQPRDENHPYGHGKVEFVSAAIEGTLICVAGLLIIVEAVNNLRHPHELGKLDVGIALVAATGAMNFWLGHMAVQKGKKSNSLALTATGEHLKSDFWSTVGLIVGLVLIYFTRLAWLDSAVALLFSGLILFTGYQILRSSIAGIMDEADRELLTRFADVLQKNRRENWVDLHNLRAIKYGSTVHLDCHLTVPWFLNVHEAHREVDQLDRLAKDNFGESVELFVHTDGCLDFSCRICEKKGCAERKFPFEKRVEWSLDNILNNSKHRLEG